LKAGKVFVFLDTCFSGAAARQPETLLLEGTRPVGLKVTDPAMVFPNLIVLSAAGRNQVSNAYESQRHGLFTYFLIKGLLELGGKDRSGSGVRELAASVRENVSSTARREFGPNQQQDPVLRIVGEGSNPQLAK
jgi:hypothetical protein